MLASISEAVRIGVTGGRSSIELAPLAVRIGATWARHFFRNYFLSAKSLPDLRNLILTRRLNIKGRLDKGVQNSYTY